MNLYVIDALFKNYIEPIDKITQTKDGTQASTSTSRVSQGLTGKACREALNILNSGNDNTEQGE